MNISKYFLVLFAILIQLTGLAYYSHYVRGWLYGFEFLLILGLIFSAVVILLTLGYDTKLPSFLLLAFFVVTILDALLLYFRLGSTRLFAIMTAVGAVGIVMAINLLSRAAVKETREEPVVKTEVKVEAPKKKTARKKTTKKKKTRRKKRK